MTARINDRFRGVRRWCGRVWRVGMVQVAGCLIAAAIFFVGGWWGGCAAAAQEGAVTSSEQSGVNRDIETIRNRMVASLRERPPSAGLLRMLVRTLNPDGSWPDVDYRSSQMASWPTDHHLQRVLQLAEAFRAAQDTSDPPKLGQELKAAVILALEYWLAHDFQSPNWWHNRIEVPRLTGQILLLLGDTVPPADRNRAIDIILSRASISMTGQNRVWLAQNVFLRGLATGNVQDLRDALATIQEEVRVTTEEGIQPDNSFHQHGPQQQFGNYGLSFAQTEAEWAALVRGTSFALPANQRLILRNYLLGGLRWVVWRDRMDISGLGRQLYPGAQQSKARGAAAACRTMSLVDPDQAAAYQSFAASVDHPGSNESPLVGDRAFWRSDMIVHRTPVFYTSVRMCSPRVISTESGNGENLQGAHLGDGATYLYQRGDEYQDIFPVWDWRRIPGTTAYTEGPLPQVSWSGLKNDSDFVGEVSDGTDGAAAMEFSRDGLAANKAWFFFKQGYIALGAGIHSDRDEPVATTINQCLLHGPVVVSDRDGTRALAAGSRLTLHGPAWVLHDGAGYLLLGPGAPGGPGAGDPAITVSSQDQTGAWSSVISNQPPATVTRSVFSIGIEHGVHPDGATYAYAVLPGVTVEQMRAHDPGFRVLENSPALQAVTVPAEGLTEAVFHQPGTLPDDSRLTVDQPCLILLRRSGSSLALSAADPTQKLETIRVHLKGRFGGAGATFDPAANQTTVILHLGRGGDAGRTVTSGGARPSGG